MSGHRYTLGRASREDIRIEFGEMDDWFLKH